MKKPQIFLIFILIFILSPSLFAKRNISRFQIGETQKYQNYKYIKENSKGISYMFDENGKEYFVYNGKKQTTYDDIVNIVYTSNNENYAYVGMENKIYEIVHNGKKIKSTRNEIKNLFITDKYLAYIETINGKDSLFLINKIIAKYDEITDGIFFENGSYIISVRDGKNYKIFENKKLIADSRSRPLIKEKRGCLFIVISPLTANMPLVGRDVPKENLHAYMIENYNKYKLDKIEVFKSLKSVGDIYISDSGESFVFIAEEVGFKSKTVFTNNKKHRDIISVNEVVFSPNGKRYLFSAKRAQGDYVIGDDDQFGPYKDGIVDMAFTPNSKKWGYLGRNKVRTAVVVGGEGFSAYYYAGNLKPSEDGKIWSLIASSTGNLYYVTKNRIDGKSYKNIYAMDMSKSGKKLGYVAETSKGETKIILNEKESEYYGDAKTPFIFIEDNYEVWTSRENNKSYMMINGEKIGTYDNFMNTPIYDEKRGLLRWQASIGENIYLFTTVLK